MKTCSEIVEEVLDFGDNPQGNQVELARHDANETDEYIKHLHEQVESTEYLFYNTDDWIDDVVDITMEKIRNELLNAKGGLTEGDIDEIIETHRKRLQFDLFGAALEACNGVEKVYT